MKLMVTCFVTGRRNHRQGRGNRTSTSWVNSSRCQPSVVSVSNIHRTNGVRGKMLLQAEHHLVSVFHGSVISTRMLPLRTREMCATRDAAAVSPREILNR